MDDNKKNELFGSGLKLFNEREFYDAHEYWEELWLEYHLSDKKFVQGLIQMTVGYYHLSTGNKKGALSLFNKCLNKMQLFTPDNRGIDVEEIIDRINRSIDIIEKEQDFDWDLVPRLNINIEYLKK